MQVGFYNLPLSKENVDIPNIEVVPCECIIYPYTYMEIIGRIMLVEVTGEYVFSGSLGIHLKETFKLSKEEIEFLQSLV